MSENGHGGASQKRSSGDDNNGAADHKVWQRLARAALVVKKSGGMNPDPLCAWLWTMLDGQAALALEAFEIKDLTVDGGEVAVF